MKVYFLKYLLNILLYTSLVCLLAYLYLNDLLIIPQQLFTLYFVLSIVFLFVGYLFDVKAWNIIAETEIGTLSFKNAYISTGKFIFSKYIPGKVWVIFGKAAYLKKQYNSSNIINLTSLSTYYVLVSLLAGTFTGLFALLKINHIWFLIVGVSTVVLIFLITILSKQGVLRINKIICAITKRVIKLPYVSPKITIKLLLLSFGNWLFWSLAFYQLLVSIQKEEIITADAAFLFPLSAVAGILVIFAPGGIGFREGLLAYGLTVLGMNTKEAASIAVFSRLWFLIGEIIIFLTALMMEYERNRKQKIKSFDFKNDITEKF